jgi:putative transposase
LAGALEPSMIDALLADAKISGTPIDGVDGLLNRMTKAVIELWGSRTSHMPLTSSD